MESNLESYEKKFVVQYRPEIEATGRLFAYLRLAKMDKDCVLGWRPAQSPS